MTWVCVSDLHAGGLTSLLRDLPEGSAVTISLADAFAAAVEGFLADLMPNSSPPAQLILLGDVLDLQFSRRSTATAQAVRFLRALHQTGCFADTVLATAGNHDHAIWAQARLAMETAAVEDDVDDSKYATSAFEVTPTAQSGLLNAVVGKAGFTGVDLRYPNIGLANPDRAVVLHHGHYIESEYRLITTIKDAICNREAGAVTAETLAAENAAWVDFAWSPFNDADRLEEVYQNFLTTAGFRRITRVWTEKAAAALSEMLPFPGNAALRQAVRTATKAGVEATLGRVRDTERMAEVTSLTKGGLEGLIWYLEQPTRRQIAFERPDFSGDVTFVMGHTHRPFSLRVNAQGYASPVRVYNTGGWTLNGPRLDNAEGAALVLIDDELNVASLRLFSTPNNGLVPKARIEMLSNGTSGEKAFQARLEASLAKSEPLWEALRQIVQNAYFDRQALLLDLTDPTESEAS